MRTKSLALILPVLLTLQPLFADETGYVEPGSLRLSHELVLENIMHRVSSGWRVENGQYDKTYSETGPKDPPWKAEWGQSLLTEAATRLTPDIFGRILFELQGDYADRFWNANNYEHHIDNVDRHAFVRQAEARIDRDEWFVHGFKGVGHGDWATKGDFFGLYPQAFPERDYLHESGYYGIYPDRFKQDLYLNHSKRHVPRGFEGGLQFMGFDFGAAVGNELTWGYNKAAFFRATAPLMWDSKLTFVYKNDDVPYNPLPDNDERDRVYALSWMLPTANATLETGVMYRPFRVNELYQSAEAVDSGGLLGSGTEITTKRTDKNDAFAERLKYERHSFIKDHEFIWSADALHAGLLAGNKNQLDLTLASDIVPVVKGIFQYTYRKPIEGPVPFLYEGTPDNIVSVAAAPRGPNSPFWVDWDNREAIFLTTTFVFDPTPGTTLLIYEPDTLASWNVNPEENAPVTAAVQYRMSDYKTTTDRQYYYDANGNIVFEPAGHNGAWASNGPLHEFRLMLYGRPQAWNWMLGFAGGQSPALLGLAYSNDTSVNKPLTDYYSFEGKLQHWPFTFWGHYGNGVWGAELYQRSFGESYDRLYGLGTSYNITVNTVIDVSYIAARQDDNLFVAPDLGSYDEIRTVFSHRFGFLMQFSDPARAGYKAR